MQTPRSLAMRLLIASGWVIALLAAAAPGRCAAQTADWFEPPVRLKAGEAFVDTGDNWGHSGPCFEDYDEDGLRDLIVGDFSGKFHVFRNIGSSSEPQFTQGTYLKAGDEDAKVFVY